MDFQDKNKPQPTTYGTKHKHTASFAVQEVIHTFNDFDEKEEYHTILRVRNNDSDDDNMTKVS